MSKRLPILAALIACLSGGIANAQDIDLAANGAQTIWRGTQSGAFAGASLDQGSLGGGDNRRDLLIGAPGSASIAGKVYILFGGPLPTGDRLLSTAHVTLNGAAAGDRFGFATATGDILSPEGATIKTLVVGAPGAMTNRGIVYVYSGGFLHGDVVPASSAVTRIIGNTGDQLGTALATGDLNNDSYREIIIGAPGTGRIYVIAGGPTLPATIDLSTTAAAWTIQYPGLGLQLAAGDVTGDGIYDVIAGHPSVNAVHVMRGRNGQMPNGFEMTFGGIDADDGVGLAIRVGDFDADGTRDLVIGAPGGDGPANSRVNAGEAYVLWGGPTLSGRSLINADVTFFGRDAGSRLGAVLAAGDINRDTPNDFVLGGTGARGGAGDLHVYYGRARNLIGILAGSGRVVDFANELPSRSILGDTAGGTVTAALVFEVTGEGARDVIVGMSGNTSNAGAAYFTISPKLTLGTNSVSLSGFQGIVSSSPVPVRNISDIPITWQTSSNRPWLSATTSGSTSAATPGDVVIHANGQGLTPGTHTGIVTVTSTSEHLTMFATIDVTFQVRETQPSPSTPPEPGQPSGNRYRLLWRHNVDGWLAFWNMDGITLRETTSVSINQMPDTSWRIAGMGDLNGDGHRDLIWQNDANGRLAAWLLVGDTVTFTGSLSIPSLGDNGWKIRGTGDTNGDRKADLIFQHNDGRLAVWYMNGTQVTGTTMLSIDRMPHATWHIRAVGDTNGDGLADILWHKSDTGELAVWYLNGWIVTGTHRLSIGSMTDTNWSIVGSEDVNGDGKFDIIWQHSTGSVATWYLNGHTVTATLFMNPRSANSTAWKIAGPK